MGGNKSKQIAENSLELLNILYYTKKINGNIITQIEYLLKNGARIDYKISAEIVLTEKNNKLNPASKDYECTAIDLITTTNLNKTRQGLAILKLFRKYQGNILLKILDDGDTALEKVLDCNASINMIKYLIIHTKYSIISDLNTVISLIVTYNDADLLKLAQTCDYFPITGYITPGYVSSTHPIINVSEEVAKNTKIMDLLSEGFDFNCTVVIENQDRLRSCTPLMVACTRKIVPLIEYFVAKGANVNKVINSLKIVQAKEDNHLIELLMKLEAKIEPKIIEEQIPEFELEKVDDYSSGDEDKPIYNPDDNLLGNLNT